METYKCRSCKEDKSINEFRPAKTKLGHETKCRKCWATYMRDYYQRNPDKYKKQKEYVAKNDIEYKKSYRRHGLTDTQFELLFGKYDGKCWSCQNRTGTCVDHDHLCCPGQFSCGKCVRGILCNWCNSVLGHANDSIEVLKLAIQYLETQAP